MSNWFDAIVSGAGIAFGSIGVIVAAIAVIGFFLASSNKAVVCAGYMLIAFLFEIFMHEQPYVQIGLQVYPNDVVFMVIAVCIGLVGVSRRLPVFEFQTVVWLLLGAVMMASFGQGLMQYGKAAGTELREVFYFWVAGLFCCTVPLESADIRRLARWFLWGAYALIGIAVYRWVGLALGFVPRSLLLDVGVTSVFRALPSHAAFYLSVVALVQTMAWLRGTGRGAAGLHALVLTAFVLILQHRSVWVAHALGGAYLLVQERRFLPQRFALLLGFTLVAGMGLGIAAMLGALDGLFDALQESTASLTSSRSSVTDRVFGWESLVVDWSNSSVGTLLLGFPFGHGWRRVVDGRIIEFSSHNFYVDLLLRLGVVGVGLMLLATLTAMVHGLRAKAESEHEYLLLRGLGLVLLASLVYYIPYSGNYLHGAVTGLALAQVIRRHQRDRAPLPQPGGAWRGAGQQATRGYVP